MNITSDDKQFTKMKHLKTLQELNEASENLNISDVICSLNCKCDYIVTAEQGHRIIKCLKCGEVKPI